jgi:hypothetical protein
MTQENPPTQSATAHWGRTRLVKVGAAYLALIGLGMGALFEFVPSFFEFGQRSFPQILVLLAFLIFVGAPVVAIGYLLLSVAVEALVMAVEWMFKACLRTLVRFFKKLCRGADE